MLAYTAGQWREIARCSRGRQARYGTLAGDQRARRPRRSWSPINYIGTQQNKRWDLTANKQFSAVGPEPQRAGRSSTRRCEITVFAQEQDFPRYQDRLEGVRVLVQAA